jgi:2TM domain
VDTLVQAHPEAARGRAVAGPELRLVETRRRRAKLHLFTYVVGNVLFWALWGTVGVSADHWYWWPVVPLAGWTLVLALHLRHVYRSVSR